MAQKLKYLTFNQIQDLLNVIRSPRDKAVFALGFGRGLRACEVGKLRYEDYRKHGGAVIWVSRLKGSISSEAALWSWESRALNAWIKMRGDEPGPLFISRKHRPISQQMLDVLMKRYGAAARTPPDRRCFRTLRHSCAMYLLNDLDWDVAKVQRVLGHANIQNTLIYCQLSSASMRKAMDRAELEQHGRRSRPRPGAEMPEAA